MFQSFSLVVHEYIQFGNGVVNNRQTQKSGQSLGNI